MQIRITNNNGDIEYTIVESTIKDQNQKKYFLFFIFVLKCFIVWRDIKYPGVNKEELVWDLV